MVEIALFEFMMIAWKKKTETGQSRIPMNVNKYEYCFWFCTSCVNVSSDVLAWQEFPKIFSVHLWNETEISQPWLEVL